jgi:hypothetical protein
MIQSVSSGIFRTNWSSASFILQLFAHNDDNFQKMEHDNVPPRKQYQLRCRCLLPFHKSILIVHVLVLISAPPVVVVRTALHFLCWT